MKKRELLERIKQLEERIAALEAAKVYHVPSVQVVGPMPDRYPWRSTPWVGDPLPSIGDGTTYRTVTM